MRRCSAVVLFSIALCVAHTTGATRPVADYLYFRALAIDLLGRPPTRDEIAQLERSDFDLDHWIDEHLTGPRYAERLRRIYMDLMRLELPPNIRYEPAAIALHPVKIEGPGGPVTVYFRLNQRRLPEVLDGTFCFTEDESGLKVGRDGSVAGTPRPIPQTLLDARTVEVKPWWLYADYRRPDPVDRAQPDWAQRFPGYDLDLKQFVDADGRPTTTVRVCKEEAQVAETGHVYASGRIASKATPIPRGRATRPPGDSAFARANRGRAVSCLTELGFENSTECGCGVGLERCLPTAPAGFVVPVQAPLGADQPFAFGPQPASLWSQRWWSEEAAHFMDRIFEDDRDVRELLTSRATVINGPLAQFYRFLADGKFGATGADLGYVDPVPLFEPRAVPASLVPEDTSKWVVVPDRGPHAAGLMTMPVFLLKYGSRRARAHVLYNTFLCHDFVAASVTLAPSDQPDLTKRPGCSACHVTLEPMAAYFSRIQENDWTFLPATTFPMSLPRCTAADPKQMPGVCRPYYDPDFTDAHHTTLRGAYASPEHAEAGPAGLGAEITSSPEFAGCVVKNVAQSLLGRQLTPDDDEWQDALAKDFVAHGYRMRSLVRAILTSPAYRNISDDREAKP